MNFLAHLFLSCDRDKLMVGNFIADYIQNRHLEHYEGGVLEGILLHRKIDTYTDNHPVVREGTKLLRPYHSKYAPVVLDLFYDYLLIKNWETFADKDLDAFAKAAYQVLDEHIEIMPIHLKRRLPGMIQGDWLQSYGKESGVAYAIERMKSRVSRPEWLAEPLESLRENLVELDEGFKTFFPDVIRYVREECKCM